jgi:hypothetical protein
MKAIETIYDGHRFRSRLEARWAVFFNALNIRYEYEKEGFDLDGLWYLPDFWLPDQKCWIEIKGATTEDDFEKASRLFHHQLRIDRSIRVFMLFEIPSFDFSGQMPACYEALEFNTLESGPPYYDDMRWGICPICGRVDFTDHGFTRGLPCGCLKPVIGLIDKIGSTASEIPEWWREQVIAFSRVDIAPPILAAYDAARMARFEHGRSGN